tara:strand:+ start:188 stop:676 length:489 start_codon:yes stop_codon:yes gene_type:complete
MELDNIPLNPIDVVEDVIYEKKWSFSRADDYELVADISSKLCQYRLYFSWSEDVRAMSFTITFDLKFPNSKLFQAYELISLINEKLWIGHFDITSKNGIPAFRHTILSRSDNDLLHKKLEDLVDIGVYECEKYYQSFQQVLFDEIDPRKSLVFANFEVAGTA